MMKNCGGTKAEANAMASDDTAMWQHIKKQMHGAAHVPTGHNDVNGCFHRDLKLENLILTGDYDVKIIDYGSLKFTEHCTGAPTQIETADGKTVFSTHTAWVGTDVFRPPTFYYSESTQHDPAAWDVWAVGGILLFLVGGDHVYNRLRGEAYKVFQLAMKEAHPAWKAHGAAVGEAELYVQWTGLDLRLAKLRAECALYQSANTVRWLRDFQWRLPERRCFYKNSRRTTGSRFWGGGSLPTPTFLPGPFPPPH